ncbi:energy transducer TonB [Sphingobacterium haloxyli]|uniref:TonB C-terminal domain-containing protein n=1 Tax=Sphingobacterium haloxyli TaxID=2100533 RepID=A0A2S9IZY2_9SPHI|nr:TonB family protein [Sphingobacterium haloxyli]PRD46096.1 hypothetical protein C5745_16865 [Sphingobacterium haloxyli]
MKITILICLLWNCVAFGFGQEWPTSEFISKYNYQPVRGNFPNNSPDENNKLIPPMYPDGVEGINTMIKKEIIYPDTKKAPKNKGKVLLEYVIGTDGYVTEIKVLESAGKLYDAEAKRVLQKMERWIPASMKERNVRIRYTHPVIFK